MVAQAQCGADGEDQINGHPDGENRHSYFDPKEGGLGHNGFKEGMNHHGQYETKNPKERGIQKTDPSVQIETMLGVIPPTHMKEFFHQDTDHIFQSAGKNHPQEENDRRMISIGV